MESVQILAQTSSQEGVPQDWLVFSLIRSKVFFGILGWIFGTLAGGLLFIFMAPIMIPHNYLNGIASAIITTLILLIVLFICLGSLWSLIVDALRLSHADKHVIILTPDDFVKQEGKKIIHVPMDEVKHVTVRGPAPVDRSLESARQDAQVGGAAENIASLFVGRRVAESPRRGVKKKRMRTPVSLAFIDGRTETEVRVLADSSYGDPYYIAAHLKEYARSAAQKAQKA